MLAFNDDKSRSSALQSLGHEPLQTHRMTCFAQKAGKSCLAPLDRARRISAPSSLSRSKRKGRHCLVLSAAQFLEDGQAAVAHHLQIDKDRPDAQGCSRPRRSPDTGKPSHDHWVSRLDADRVATGHEAPYVVCQWAIHSGLSAGLKRHASMKPAAADRATITEEMAEK